MKRDKGKPMSGPKETSSEAAVLIYLVLLAGLVCGAFIGISAGNAWLPDCQEDEYLYPQDYKGPGKNTTRDYRCVHVDEIVTGTA